MLLIRRQFERLRPDRIRRYFRQPDGDELDMDALDRGAGRPAAGVPMTDNVFIRRDKKKRDVAVPVPARHERLHRPAGRGRPPRHRRREGGAGACSRRPSVSWTTSTPSWASRAAAASMVDLFVIKDFADAFDDDVWRRASGASAARLHASGRGHPPRHRPRACSSRPPPSCWCCSSDGRPYDLGYGDMRYAMEDTKMALSEARQRRGQRLLHHGRPQGSRLPGGPVRRQSVHRHPERGSPAHQVAAHLPQPDRLRSA